MAITPPLPPSAFILPRARCRTACASGSFRYSTCAQMSCATTRADEVFAVPGGGHRAARVTRVSAGADDGRVADAAPALAGHAAGRRGRRHIARHCRAPPRRRCRMRRGRFLSPRDPRKQAMQLRAVEPACGSTRWTPVSTPWSRANSSAPAPTSMTCGEWSMTRRASVDGILHVFAARSRRRPPVSCRP